MRSQLDGKEEEHSWLQSCTNQPKPGEPVTASCSFREPEFLETPEKQRLVIPPHHRPNFSLPPSLPYLSAPTFPLSISPSVPGRTYADGAES